MSNLHDAAQPSAPQLPEHDAPEHDAPSRASLLERRETAWSVACAAIALGLIGLIAILRIALISAPDAFTEPPKFLTDINTAPAAELALLPGIGPQLAARIIAERQSRGPFTSADALLRVHGIGPKTVEQLRPLVVCSNPLRSASPPASERDQVADAH